VHKPQGPIRHCFLNSRYWEFRVHGALPSPIPFCYSFLSPAEIVLRVLPRTPRGITDLPLPFFLPYTCPSLSLTLYSS